MFHVISRGDSGSGSGNKKKARYKVSPSRIAIGIGLVAILTIAASLAKNIWPEAARLFSDVTNYSVGGLIGAVLGEISALKEVQSETADAEGDTGGQQSP
jgi:hypothetical protein